MDQPCGRYLGAFWSPSSAIAIVIKESPGDAQVVLWNIVRRAKVSFIAPRGNKVLLGFKALKLKLSFCGIRNQICINRYFLGPEFLDSAAWRYCERVDSLSKCGY